MSTHYHAAQSRGFSFTIYELQCSQWRTAFTAFDPTRIASILNLTYDEDHLYLRYMDRAYRLRLIDGVLEKHCPGGLWTDDLFFNESMSIYHHLYYTVDHPRKPSGTWIPSAALEGLTSRNDRLPDPLLDPFAAAFTGRCECLRSACEKLGGTILSRGDVSCRFKTFPQVDLEMVFWDADEDFPAQVQILADSYASDYMHRETIGCIVSDLLERLEHTALELTGALIPLRPHHGMCMAYYQGKGYSEEFTEHMTDVLRRMDREDPMIRLVHSTDTLCSHCPFHCGDQCASAEKVDRYDREVLERCRLVPESVLKVSEFRRLVQERILDRGERPFICGDCKWNELCR